VAVNHLKDHLEILQEARWEDQTAILPIKIQDLGRRTSKSCSQL
jgi:hypothetical protein